MNTMITLHINHQTVQVAPGISVAAALAICELQLNSQVTRLSVTGQARAPLCGMGVCQECRVTIDGQAHQLACQTLCINDMQIFTGELA